MDKICSLLCIGLVCLALPAIAQDMLADRSLEVRGITELDMRPLAGATVNVYEGGIKIKTFRSGGDGSFTCVLASDKEYLIEVEKEGLVSKRISFVTQMPADEKGKWVNEFSIGLVKNCDGVDYSVLKEPVDRIRFDAKRREFFSDRDYVSRMRPRIESMLVKYEQCITSKYEDAVAKADQYFKQNNYAGAKKYYQEAQRIFPEESYPSKRLAELNLMENRQQATGEAYQKILSEAESLLMQQKMQESLAKYKQASLLNPGESYPKQKIVEIEASLNKALAENQAIRIMEDNFNNLMAKASVAYTQKNYMLALQHYKQAMAVKPGDALAGHRIQEIEGLLAKKAADDKKLREIDNNYRLAVARGDSFFRARQYEQAREEFAKAVSIKPAEGYPRNRVTEIDRQVEWEARNAEQARIDAAEKEYKAVISRADAWMKENKTNEARAAYAEALTMKPGDPYPAQRIKAIDHTASARQAEILKQQNEAYSRAMQSGSTAFAQKAYPTARVHYRKALEIRPGDPAASLKINEIDATETAEKNAADQALAAKKKYSESVALADRLFAQSDMEGAAAAYRQILVSVPGDPHCNRQLAAIESYKQSEIAARQKKAETDYANAMEKGTQAMVLANYAEARQFFMQALVVKPADAAAKQKLAEMESLIRQNEEKALAAKQIREKYEAFMASGKEWFDEKKYAEAKASFEQALQLMPGELLPRQKIDEILKIFAEQEKSRIEMAARDNAFLMAMQSGEKFFRAREYELSRVEFDRARQLKPEKQEPVARLAEIEDLIRKIQQQQQEAKQHADAYAVAINKARAQFDSKEYILARNSYQEALEHYPEDALAKEQIRKIDYLAAEEARIKEAEAKRAKEFEMQIAVADKAFDEARYTEAKEGYKKAVALDPAAVYPKQKIVRIEEILRALARPAVTQNSGTQTPVSTPVVLAELNFKTESERQRYLEDLVKKYPQGITLEIYKEKIKETYRYVIIRENQAQEFRHVKFLTYSGHQYAVNGKPITAQYFQSQTKPRPGESYQERVIQ